MSNVLSFRKRAAEMPPWPGKETYTWKELFFAGMSLKHTVIMYCLSFTKEKTEYHFIPLAVVEENFKELVFYIYDPETEVFYAEVMIDIDEDCDAEYKGAFDHISSMFEGDGITIEAVMTSDG